ncbi:MAG: hypothetical protein ACXW4L_07265, partial [Candidatus Limnocylindrales bacterium]
DRLDRVDAEGLDDGLPAFHPMSIRGTDLGRVVDREPGARRLTAAAGVRRDSLKADAASGS